MEGSFIIRIFLYRRMKLCVAPMASSPPPRFLLVLARPLMLLLPGHEENSRITTIWAVSCRVGGEEQNPKEVQVLQAMCPAVSEEEQNPSEVQVLQAMCCSGYLVLVGGRVCSV